MSGTHEGNLVQLGRSPGGGPPAESRSGTTPLPVRRRVYIETYGCQMNIGDTELMAGLLAERGYMRVADPRSADVVLVNTCAIREHAEQRVRGRIGQLQRLRKSNPNLVLGVTGCMAQRVGPALLEGSPRVDLVAGPDAYRRLGEMVEGILEGLLPRGQALLELDAHEDYEGVETLRKDGASAWVTVQRGCDHRCTFCIVPFVRGPEKNRRPSRVLAEAAAAADSGFSEVTLLGQTVNSYRYGGWTFADLLQAVARVPGLRRVRFTSPHPNDVTAELLRVMADEPTVCRQLHLPVQSGSDRVLKRMVRRYTVEDVLATVDLCRDLVPGIALSTDVIVGFPGEGDGDFEATLDLMRTVQFDDAFLYRYSAREGTPATRLPESDFVPADTAARRLERLIELQRGIQQELNQREIGTVCEVLVERAARSEGDVLGRTESNKVVAFPGDTGLCGTYVDVELTSTTGATFVGRRVA